jgi:hypothetical protein
MPSDAESNDLLRAIAELRIDVNRLIDEQVAQVKARVEEPATSPMPPRAMRLAPVPKVPDPPDESGNGRTLDPRQRLDALAKHLDHRLRQANGPAAERTERAPSSQK